MKSTLFAPALLAASMLTATFLTACTTAPRSQAGRSDLRAHAATTLANAQREDPTLGRVLDDAMGYAVFPTVGKGAVGVSP